LVPNKNAVDAFFLNKLIPENVQVRYVNRNTKYLVDNFLFLPFLTQGGIGYLHTSYIEWFRKRVLPKRNSRRKNRIFISRKKSNSRHIINEDRLVEKLNLNKYYLENISIQDQIELFYDADIIVGAHGAGLSNIIFSPAGCNVLEIRFSEDKLHYLTLAKSVGLHYEYIDAEGGHHSNTTVNPNHIIQNTTIEI